MGLRPVMSRSAALRGAQLLHAPFEACAVGGITTFARQDDAAVLEFDYRLVLPEPVIKAFPHMPDRTAVVTPVPRPRHEYVMVHEPVMILAEGNPVLRAVVLRFVEWNQVRRVDEIDIIKEEAHPAGGTAHVVDLADHASECR